MSSKSTFLGVDPSMKIPLISSAVFHLILFVMTAVGLPMVAKEPMILNTPITIEIVETGKKTQTPEPKKVEPPKPEPTPKMTAETPPDLTLPEPEPEKVEEDKKDLAPPEIVPDPDKKVTEPKKEPKKVEKKPDPKVTKVEKKDPKKDFSSLLKNLTPDEPDEKKDQPSQMDQLIENMKDDGQFAPLGEKLTMSEQDALRHQLSQCWNVLSGAKYAENLVVEVKVIVNPDRTINKAMILDRGRYNRGGAFRAAADAAMRALRNPRCSPLKLPPNKYEEWKTTIINFDPREML